MRSDLEKNQLPAAADKPKPQIILPIYKCL